MAITVKHAIFDLDGTLLDSNGMWLDAVFAYIEEHCSFGRKELPEIFEKEIIFGGTYEALEFLRDSMGDTRPFEESRELIMKSVAASYAKGRPAKDGAEEYLKFLRDSGADICIVSATPSSFVETALAQSGLLRYVDFIISGEERKSGKEKPYIFLEAAARMNCDISECCLFEDALYSIRTGKSLGMTVVCVEDFFCTPSAREEIKSICDAYIVSFRELMG